MTAMGRIEHAPAPATRCRPRPPDGGGRLARVLTAHAARAGCAVTLDILTVEPWSSATFAGTIATLSLTASPGAALSRWLAELADADLPMGRDLIADIAVEALPDGHRLRVLVCTDAMDG